MLNVGNGYRKHKRTHSAQLTVSFDDLLDASPKSSGKLDFAPLGQENVMSLIDRALEKVWEMGSNYDCIKEATEIEMLLSKAKKASLALPSQMESIMSLEIEEKSPVLDDEVRRYIKSTGYARLGPSKGVKNASLRTSGRHRSVMHVGKLAMETKELEEKVQVRQYRSNSSPVISMSIHEEHDGTSVSIMTILWTTFDTWDFDIFHLANECTGRPLVPMIDYALSSKGLHEALNLNLNSIHNFFHAIEESYLDNPYHNALHGADVMHWIALFLYSKDLGAVIGKDEFFSALIAAAIHDVAHPGRNNQFQILTNSDLAMLYNDRAILENFHLATAFKIMRNEDCNILEGFNEKRRRKIRDYIIKMVLSTDMTQHMAHLTDLKSITVNNIALTEAHRDIVLCNALHSADLSNPCRPWNLCENWALRICEEFWRQGDAEQALGLPISPLCDRSKPNVNKGQQGFISFIVQPLYTEWIKVNPSSAVCLDNLKLNLDNWGNRN